MAWDLEILYLLSFLYNVVNIQYQIKDVPYIITLWGIKVNTIVV